MKKKAAYVIFFEKNKNGIIHRRAVATFTLEELKMLNDYGDFISIDPTFGSISNSWSIIPITVIGPNRDIHSAGCIFTYTVNSEVFIWILKLLSSVLPCSKILKTIASDDDNALNSAFMYISSSNDEELCDLKMCISKINRIICFWHKSVNFNKFIHQQHFNEFEQNKVNNLFQIMGKSRDINCANKAYKELYNNPKLTLYMQTNIEKKLSYICKSMLPQGTWTLGYCSSSISESQNNSIKRLMGNKSLSLKELRDIITFCEEQKEIKQRYIKGLKRHKSIDPDIVSVMKKFNIERRIAEAIVGSIRKGIKLNGKFNGSKFIVEDENELFGMQTFEVNADGECTCRKKEQVGIPCSHYICYINAISNNNILENIPNDIVDKRWVVDESEVNNSIFDYNELMFQIPKEILKNPNQHEKYVILNEKANEIIQQAIKTNYAFDIAKSMFEKISEEIMNPKPRMGYIVQDDEGIKVGRPKYTIKIKENNVQRCLICGGNHKVINCNRRKEVYECIPEGSSDVGNRHCAICGKANHNARNCIAHRVWLEKVSKGLYSPLPLKTYVNIK